MNSDLWPIIPMTLEKFTFCSFKLSNNVCSVYSSCPTAKQLCTIFVLFSIAKIFVYFCIQASLRINFKPLHNSKLTSLENIINCSCVYSKSSLVLSASFSPGPGAAWLDTSLWNSRILWISRVKTSAGSVCCRTWRSWVGCPHTITAFARCSTPLVMSPWEMSPSPIWISCRK